jgi:hypothetical protein
VVDPPLETILPLREPGATEILSDLAFPGNAQDPETGILSSTATPLVFYRYWPVAAGNSLRVTKETSSDSVLLHFGE